MNDGMIMWSPGVTLDAIEEQVILAAFRFYQRNKTATANALGISIRTLDAKLERYENERTEREKRDAAERASGKDWLAKARGNAQTNAIAAARAEHVSSPGAGVRLESAQEAPAEQTVSVSQPKEVQKMLPQSATARDTRRAR